VPIEVDGGIDRTNVVDVVAAGASIIVAGHAIFSASDPESGTRALRAACASAASFAHDTEL
jgi:ribulose-phosphate 3-epimerase